MRRRKLIVLLLVVAQAVALQVVMANQALASFPWPLPGLP
jgi:hypothetical protein